MLRPIIHATVPSWAPPFRSPNPCQRYFPSPPPSHASSRICCLMEIVNCLPPAPLQQTAPWPEAACPLSSSSFSPQQGWIEFGVQESNGRESYSGDVFLSWARKRQGKYSNQNVGFFSLKKKRFSIHSNKDFHYYYIFVQTFHRGQQAGSGDSPLPLYLMGSVFSSFGSFKIKWGTKFNFFSPYFFRFFGFLFYFSL